MTGERPKKCDECEHGVCEDYGYSNYTVEGTTVYCSQGKHPNDGFDRGWGAEERLSFAEKCEFFVRGAPHWFEVELSKEDREELDKLIGGSRQ